MEWIGMERCLERERERERIRACFNCHPIVTASPLSSAGRIIRGTVDLHFGIVAFFKGHIELGVPDGNAGSAVVNWYQSAILPWKFLYRRVRDGALSAIGKYKVSLLFCVL